MTKLIVSCRIRLRNKPKFTNMLFYTNNEWAESSFSDVGSVPFVLSGMTTAATEFGVQIVERFLYPLHCDATEKFTYIVRQLFQDEKLIPATFENLRLISCISTLMKSRQTVPRFQDLSEAYDFFEITPVGSIGANGHLVYTAYPHEAVTAKQNNIVCYSNVYVEKINRLIDEITLCDRYKRVDGHFVHVIDSRANHESWPIRENRRFTVGKLNVRLNGLWCESTCLTLKTYMQRIRDCLKTPKELLFVPQEIVSPQVLSQDDRHLVIGFPSHRTYGWLDTRPALLAAKRLVSDGFMQS